MELAVITPPETFPFQHPTLWTERDPELELWAAPPIDAPKRYECARCHEELTADAFPANVAQPRGLDYTCWVCKRAYRRAKTAERRAAEGLKPRTRRPSEPTPKRAPTPKPVKATPPPAPIVAIEPPRKTLKDRIAERRAAAS